MKRITLAGLLLACLLLAGCGRSPVPSFSPPTTEPETVTEPEPIYAPGSPMEQATAGAVRTYLPRDACGMKAVEAGLLLFSGSHKTRLALLSGPELLLSAEASLDFFLSPEDPSLHEWEGGLSFYDPRARETVVLDQTLSEIRRIAAPRDMTGVPILSGDGKTLYYCTATALRCWDLEGGNRRLLRDFAVTGQTLAGLLAGDTLAVCARSGRTLLVSTRDGRLKYDEEADLDARNGIWYAALRQDQLLLFGEGPQSVRQLTTPDLGPARFLPRLHGAVSQGTSGLRYFDLSTGLSSELLSLAGPVLQIEGDRGSVYILARDPAYDSPVLYRWVPTLSGENCLSPYPDQDLTSCRSLAEAMGKRYGLRILIGEDAAGPWDYDLTPEPLAPITARALELVDKGLSCYPETMLSDALAPFSSLTISLVRSIAGVPGSGGVAAADGLQFFQGTDAFIVLAAGPRTEAEVHHELFHVMETRLLTSSTALDQWDNLNPAGFTYGYGSPEYLQGEERAFVDEYSMTLPKEDRARILEAAMTPGNAELFRSPILQEKLKALCHGLREAYGLKTAPEAFLWEQYLEEPLY